jgi:hypothetical protein
MHGSAIRLRTGVLRGADGQWSRASRASLGKRSTWGQSRPALHAQDAGAPTLLTLAPQFWCVVRGAAQDSLLSQTRPCGTYDQSRGRYPASFQADGASDSPASLGSRAPPPFERRAHAVILRTDVGDHDYDPPDQDGMIRAVIMARHSLALLRCTYPYGVSFEAFTRWSRSSRANRSFRTSPPFGSGRRTRRR